MSLVAVAVLCVAATLSAQLSGWWYDRSDHDPSRSAERQMYKDLVLSLNTEGVAAIDAGQLEIGLARLREAEQVRADHIRTQAAILAEDTDAAHWSLMVARRRLWQVLIVDGGNLTQDGGAGPGQPPAGQGEGLPAVELALQRELKFLTYCNLGMLCTWCVALLHSLPFDATPRYELLHFL